MSAQHRHPALDEPLFEERFQSPLRDGDGVRMPGVPRPIGPALSRRDPNTGLNDAPEIMAFLQLVRGTESLAARLTSYLSRAVDTLAEALRENGFDPLTARLVAAQVAVIHTELAAMNHDHLVAGESADHRYPAAVHATNVAFDLLRDGLAAQRAH